MHKLHKSYKLLSADNLCHL